MAKKSDHDFLSTLEVALDRIIDMDDMERGDDCTPDGEQGSLILTFPRNHRYVLRFERIK